ncbi:MAG: hypothetical protein KDD06_30225, partial [Phaeodactylibacter sp.]|nr:hypothetical protein [Phaeodactylibacter sp.]
ATPQHRNTRIAKHQTTAPPLHEHSPPFPPYISDELSCGPFLNLSGPKHKINHHSGLWAKGLDFHPKIP